MDSQPKCATRAGNGAEHVVERRRLAVEIGEHQRTPRGDGDRAQVHVVRRESFDAFHLRRAQQLAVQRVRPAVILALERLPLAAAVRHRPGAMQTDVVKAAQRVAVAQHDDRVVADVAR